MFVAGNLLSTVAFILDKLFGLYVLVIIASALISWVNPDPWNPIVRFLRSVTDPFFNVFRRILPGVLVGSAGIDLSPFFAVISVMAVQHFVLRTLGDLAGRIRVG